VNAEDRICGTEGEAEQRGLGGETQGRRGAGLPPTRRAARGRRKERDGKLRGAARLGLQRRDGDVRVRL
jgi:hypothetical protein